MSNYNGGTSKARKQFLKELQDDPDFLRYKENATQYYYRNVDGEEVILTVKFKVYSVAEDPFVTDAQITKAIKDFRNGRD